MYLSVEKSRMPLKKFNIKFDGITDKANYEDKIRYHYVINEWELES